jgi:hypothetical protein
MPFRKYCLINGLDDIGLTLRHADKIRDFEAASPARAALAAPIALTRLNRLHEREHEDRSIAG